MINELFLSTLTFFSNLFGGNIGFGIIALTVAIRTVLLPILLPSMKSQQKMLNLKSEVDKLKKKYKDDKKLFQQKQLELYQQHNINPLGGCLPQIIQALLFIAFYQFLISSLNVQVLAADQLHFFGWNLHEKDTTYILPVLAGLSQFLLAIILKPATSTVAEKELASQTPTKKDDKEAEDMTDMAQAMQGQMLFIMPIMIGFFAISLPAGLSLYWITSSIFSAGQQLFISGPGGLKPILSKLGITLNQ